MNDNDAEVHVVVVHAVPGFTALPAPTVSLLSEKNVSVWVTTEPHEVGLHVDRKSALATLLFTGGVGGDAFEDRFTSALEEARSYRNKQARSQAWLVTDSFMVARLLERPSRELPEFNVAIGRLSVETREDLGRLADSALGRVSTALSMILGESRFPDVKRVASAHYSQRPGSARVTYELHIEGSSPTLFLSSAADEKLIGALRHSIRQLGALGIETALRLHKDALETTGDELRAFIAAWASLEILVNKAWSAQFSAAVVLNLGLADTGWEGALRARLMQPDPHRLGIVDHFGFIAVLLSKGSAESDCQAFSELNRARNDLYHRGIVARRMPSRDAISLFRKYLSLLLTATKSLPA